NFSRTGVSTSLSFSRLVPWFEAQYVRDPGESLVPPPLEPEPQAARPAAVAAARGAADRSVRRRIGGLLGGAVIGERSQRGTVGDCRAGRYGETGAYSIRTESIRRVWRGHDGGANDVRSRSRHEEGTARSGGCRAGAGSARRGRLAGHERRRGHDGVPTGGEA